MLARGSARDISHVSDALSGEREFEAFIVFDEIGVEFSGERPKIKAWIGIPLVIVMQVENFVARTYGILLTAVWAVAAAMVASWMDGL